MDNETKTNESVTVSKNSLQQILTNSVAMSRQVLQNKLTGISGQKHNVYEAVGYPDIITFDQYWKMFTRGGLAKRVIEAYTDYTWVQNPIIKEATDDETKDTEFDIKVAKLIDKQKLWNKLQRFDVVSGIGQYGGLLMGFSDGLSASLPVGKVAELSFLRPLPEKYMIPNKINSDPTSERYGKPETYTITSSGSNGCAVSTSEVHWSRVLNFSWSNLENDFYGTPALQSTYNHLLDLEKINAASGEGYWKGAYPGLSITADSDASFDKDAKESMKEASEKYDDDMTRILQLQGVKVAQLRPVVSSPEKQVDVIITQIAGTEGIPKRIFIGSEAGQLASTQDENNWMKTIKNRQETLIIPMIIEALFDRLIEFKVLPAVNYKIVFPDPYAPSEAEILSNSKLLMEVINAYLDGDASDIFPLTEFLMQIMGYSLEAAEKIESQYFNMIKEEEDDDDEDDLINNNELIDTLKLSPVELANALKTPKTSFLINIKNSIFGRKESK